MKAVDATCDIEFTNPDKTTGMTTFHCFKLFLDDDIINNTFENHNFCQ